MRIDIDGNGGADALHRARLRKNVGRKHNHQPRGRAVERRRLHLKRSAEYAAVLRRKFNALVAAYWRGELENHP